MPVSQTPEVCLRRARPDERSALEAPQLQASMEWEEDRPFLLADPGLIQLPTEHIAEDRVTVAEQAGRPIGFSVVLQRKNGEVELDGLFIEPGRWGEGIGRRLLTEAERRARSEGAVKLVLTANLRSVGFYAACGYGQLGEVRSLFGSAMEMSKDLSAP